MWRRSSSWEFAIRLLSRKPQMFYLDDPKHPQEDQNQQYEGYDANDICRTSHLLGSFRCRKPGGGDLLLRLLLLCRLGAVGKSEPPAALAREGGASRTPHR